MVPRSLCSKRWAQKVACGRTWIICVLISWSNIALSPSSGITSRHGGLGHRITTKNPTFLTLLFTWRDLRLEICTRSTRVDYQVHPSFSFLTAIKLLGKSCCLRTDNQLYFTYMPLLDYDLREDNHCGKTMHWSVRRDLPNEWKYHLSLKVSLWDAGCLLAKPFPGRPSGGRPKSKGKDQAFLAADCCWEVGNSGLRRRQHQTSQKSKKMLSRQRVFHRKKHRSYKAVSWRAKNWSSTEVSVTIFPFRCLASWTSRRQKLHLLAIRLCLNSWSASAKYAWLI